VNNTWRWSCEAETCRRLMENKKWMFYNTWRWSCEAETCRRLIENKKWMCYNTWRWPCEAETCRRLIENKKWMCYIDGQKNEYTEKIMLSLTFCRRRHIDSFLKAKWPSRGCRRCVLQTYTSTVGRQAILGSLFIPGAVKDKSPTALRWQLFCACRSTVSWRYNTSAPYLTASSTCWPWRFWVTTCLSWFHLARVKVINAV
jgi:hypothetical protein